MTCIVSEVTHSNYHWHILCITYAMHNIRFSYLHVCSCMWLVCVDKKRLQLRLGYCQHTPLRNVCVCMGGGFPHKEHHSEETAT